jgi:hypothetical protein
MSLPGFTAEVTIYGRAASFHEVAAWDSYSLAGTIAMAACPAGQTQVCNQVCTGYSNVCNCVPTTPPGCPPGTGPNYCPGGGYCRNPGRCECLACTKDTGPPY